VFASNSPAGANPDNETLIGQNTSSEDAARARLDALGGWVMFTAAVAAMLFCLLLMVRGYVRCPFWDQWWVVAQIADGESPRSLAWLWSQQNEHRILFPRLLVWLDVSVFGARNVSLFLFTFTVQFAHWLLWIFAIRRWGPADRGLRWTLVGLFGYCLFCPNQIENFVWAFQFLFLLTFFLATLAFVCALLLDEVKARRSLMAAEIAAPLLAMCNIAAGLLIWPFLIVLSYLRKANRRLLTLLLVVGAASYVAYFAGYQRPPYHSGLWVSLQSPKLLFRYILTFFGTSWWFLLPHLARTIALAAICVALFLFVSRVRGRESTGKFELLLFAELAFLLTTAFVTALGRMTMGIGQASSSRYQTPAMLFWACLASLLLLWLGRRGNVRLLVAARALIVMAVSLSAFGMRPIYSANEARARELGNACEVVASGRLEPGVTDKLLDRPDVLKRGSEYLRHVWKRKR
jgi:hypothetical protein